jgi:hypothetical protein
MTNKIYFENKVAYDWIRYKDEYWISHRKRVFLYWFKYLREAEQNPEFTVDWSKYAGWGGANLILGSKFDDWWRDHWVELFGTKDRSAQPKFTISTKQPKAEALRLSLLCWQRRDAPVWGKRGNALSIAKQVYEYELGISGEKRPRYGDDEFTAGSMNPDGYKSMSSLEGSADKQRLQSIVRRYLKNGRRYLNNVCEGRFP